MLLLLPLILSLLSLSSADPIPLPLPLPAAAPAPIPAPTPQPQTYNTYAPFSGAIYIVNAAGTSWSSASPALCPANAPQGCGDIGVWNWCCPTSNTCALLTPSLVGCCPVGSSCSGTPAGAISTVTVTVTQTQWAQGPTVVINNQVTTRPVPVVPVPPGPTTTFKGFCSTLVASGPGLPAVRQGWCGSILVVNEGRRGADLDWRLLVGLGGAVGGVLGW